MPGGTEELCRENPPRWPTARLLPGETGIYTDPAYPAGEPGHHDHNADVGPLTKRRQSFPSPRSSPPLLQPAPRGLTDPAGLTDHISAGQ